MTIFWGPKNGRKSVSFWNPRDARKGAEDRSAGWLAGRLAGWCEGWLATVAGCLAVAVATMAGLVDPEGVHGHPVPVDPPGHTPYPGYPPPPADHPGLSTTSRPTARRMLADPFRDCSIVELHFPHFLVSHSPGFPLCRI